ncbi:hypothetical protein H696_02200 [Fonticula alba]|uniref:TH1 domain-containing protein n=1 Tax=Fonticula alba TaxID=691883 RepID=A0A058ZAD2_FONAL|nr:hypothetical protein H696_02200 [Fonticula alba]KCV71250.1 hypothetical protein H696_02200 [Fonticula alba]|eukprot:XP_009494373.1 hypothetical protein H696_02200 [Fonticula alba]
MSDELTEAFTNVTLNSEPAATEPPSAAGATDADKPSETTTMAFLGQKERRRSSAVKMFLGDYLSLASNANIIKVLARHRDQKITFSDIVVKINKRNKMQERILLLTEEAIYNIDPTNHKVKRRIALRELGGVRLSCLPDNFFCLHVPSEYDYLMVSNRKTEIVTKLMESYRELTGGDTLPVAFANTFDYRIDTDVYRDITFSEVEGGVSTQIFAKKKEPKNSRR